MPEQMGVHGQSDALLDAAGDLLAQVAGPVALPPSPGNNQGGGVLEQKRAKPLRVGVDQPDGRFGQDSIDSTVFFTWPLGMAMWTMRLLFVRRKLLSRLSLTRFRSSAEHQQISMATANWTSNGMAREGCQSSGCRQDPLGQGHERLNIGGIFELAEEILVRSVIPRWPGSTRR